MQTGMCPGGGSKPPAWAFGTELEPLAQSREGAWKRAQAGRSKQWDHDNESITNVVSSETGREIRGPR